MTRRYFITFLLYVGFSLSIFLNLSKNAKIKELNSKGMKSVQFSSLLRKRDKMRSVQEKSCMTSTEHCVEFIHNYTGVQPTLLSFYKNNSRVSNKHPVSGKPFKVPNIVHLIRIGEEQPFRFYNYVGYKSFHKYLKPLAIFLWADRLPDNNNTWWRKIIQEVANIFFVQIQPITKIAGRKIKYTAHAADYMRIQLIKGNYYSRKSMIGNKHRPPRQE